MKIKSIAAICKKNKQVVLFNRYSDKGMRSSYDDTQQYIDINHIAAIANSRGNSLFRVDDPPQIAIHHPSESIVLYLSWRCHRLRSPQEQPG